VEALTVILPAFNSARTLGAALSSIIAQNYSDWELLLMDDGSSDCTVDIARTFGDRRIRVIADGVHRGLPTQLNRGVAMAQGKYIARMDADDLAYPSRFQKQVEFLEEHPSVDLVAAWMTVFRSDGSLVGTRRFPTAHPEICRRPWAGFPMAHPTWMGRSQWFRDNRYSEESVRMEDRELLLRTYAKSQFAVIPDVLLGYREDSLSLRKILVARKNTCKMAASFAVRERKFLLPALLILGQCSRAAVEAIALPTGLKYKALRSRAQTPTTDERAAWEKIWATITKPDASKKICSRGSV
jgi:glycosyltransferase involved in cell wall biosynthesis